MSLRDVIDAASALAISQKLWPDEVSVWERYCREYSSRFNTSLAETRELDPFFVINQVVCDNLENFEPEERLQELWELINQLKDPNYDAKKEAAFREEIRQIEERERIRLEKGEAIHPSLENDKRVITKEQPPKQKELPKAGGINFDLINKLNKSDNEG